MCELQVLTTIRKATQYKDLDPRQVPRLGLRHGRRRTAVTSAPIGEWNYQEVTVMGSTIKVELNGTVILDCDLSKVTEYMGDSAHPGKDRKIGHFGFAGHNDPVQFRNIAIKKLK